MLSVQIIRSGRCLDLSQDASREIVREAFSALKQAYAVAGIAMPRNEPNGDGGNDLVKRFLDCAVFEFVHHMRETGAGESGSRRRLQILCL